METLGSFVQCTKSVIEMQKNGELLEYLYKYKFFNVFEILIIKRNKTFF